MNRFRYAINGMGKDNLSNKKSEIYEKRDL